MKVKINNVDISSIASYLPEEVLCLSSLENVFGKKEVANIIKATGIEQVRIARKGQTASDMCIEAANLLFDNEKIDVNEIDGLILFLKLRII
jgi:3-oxoacyl-[acyl-carrier-protein] synthase III